MLEVLSALAGESIAVFEDEELANCPSQGIKEALGAKAWHPTLPTTDPSRQLPTG